MNKTHEDKAALSVPEDFGPVSRTTQALRDALAGYSGPDKACPNCGSMRKHCRPVPAGYWCQADGLLADDSAFVHTEPDPQAEMVKADPQRLVAAMNLKLAQESFDEADIAWREAEQAVELATRTARRTEPVFDQSSPTGWRTTQEAAKLARSVPALELAAQTAKRIRTERAIDLEAASVAYQRAVDDALHRAGLPRVGGNVAATDLRTLVGGVM
jgi:hypothetical protein